MTRTLLMRCKADKCTNTFSPSPKATNPKYCSDACKQRMWRKDQKARKNAQLRTLAIEDAEGFFWLQNQNVGIESIVEKYDAVTGGQIRVEIVKMLGELGTALKAHLEGLQNHD